MFDNASDVTISVNLPDELVIQNNANVSTLKSIEGKIVRVGDTVYNFQYDVDITAGESGKVKVNNFILQEGDEPKITKADFSWDM